MKRIETPEFSIAVHPEFEHTRTFNGDMMFNMRTKTYFSPYISIGAKDAHLSLSPEEEMTKLLGEKAAVERKNIYLAGMTGESAKTKGSLTDYDTGETKDWYGLEVLLVSADKMTWYQASAKTTLEDMAVTESAIAYMLDSIEINLSGAEAREAREAENARTMACIRELMEKGRNESALDTAVKQEAQEASIDDVETRFKNAASAAGLCGRYSELRRVAVPALSLTEYGEPGIGDTGRSRVGGGPDLPEGIEWPRCDGAFHWNFLAQVNLGELPAFHEDMPKNGLLSFFTGEDYTRWKVLYFPAGTVLEAHELPEDAEYMTITAHRMLSWDRDQERYIIDAADMNGLAVETDGSGRMFFTRGGEPVPVFSSEYDISWAARLLRIEQSLSIPSYTNTSLDQDSEFYESAGLEDSEDALWEIKKSMGVGDGPQHQMFGLAEDMDGYRERAAEYACEQGWTDIAEPGGWFVLLKLASGGEANFSFSDYGDLIFMIHRADAAKGDFSRVHAFVVSS